MLVFLFGTIAYTSFPKRAVLAGVFGVLIACALTYLFIRMIAGIRRQWKYDYDSFDRTTIRLLSFFIVMTCVFLLYLEVPGDLYDFQRLSWLGYFRLVFAMLIASLLCHFILGMQIAYLILRSEQETFNLFFFTVINLIFIFIFRYSWGIFLLIELGITGMISFVSFNEAIDRMEEDPAPKPISEKQTIRNARKEKNRQDTWQKERKENQIKQSRDTDGVH